MILVGGRGSVSETISRWKSIRHRRISSCLLAAGATQVESSRLKAKEEAKLEYAKMREMYISLRRTSGSWHLCNSLQLSMFSSMFRILIETCHNSIGSYDRATWRQKCLQCRRIARFISREVVTFLINEPTYDMYDRDKKPFALTAKSVSAADAAL
jgi:hypothetical protein